MAMKIQLVDRYEQAGGVRCALARFVCAGEV